MNLPLKDKDKDNRTSESIGLENHLHPILQPIPVESFGIYSFIESLADDLKNERLLFLGYGTGGIIFKDTLRSDVIKIVSGSFTVPQAEQLINILFPTADSNTSGEDVFDPYYDDWKYNLLNMLASYDHKRRDEMVLRAAVGSILGSKKHPGVIDSMSALLLEEDRLVGCRMPFIPGDAVHSNFLPEPYKQQFDQIYDASLRDGDIYIDVFDNTANTMVTPDEHLKIIDVDANWGNPLMDKVLEQWFSQKS